MGFLDRASGKLKAAGEETVRVVDYDNPTEEEPKQEKQKREPKEKAERSPRKLFSFGKKGEEKSPEHEEIREEVQDEDSEESLALAYKIATDSQFEIDEDQPFYAEQESNIPKPKRPSIRDGIEYDEKKIKDVLEVLHIPATFIIRDDVLMPEDFKKVEFDLQIPQGYDIGQVEFFVERSESTVAEYLSLLEQRNDHVAKLATTVDRLQVDLENLKLDSQIAAGIGIMPTSDNDELERDNLELRLQVKRLEDALKSKASMPDLSSKERDLYEDLRNQFSILERDNHTLVQENSDLRIEIARMEEEQDDEGSWVPNVNAAAMPAMDDGISSINYMEEGAQYGESLPDAPLPNFSLPAYDEDDLPLPSVDSPADDEPAGFVIEDNFDSSNVVVSGGEINDDEDDELEQLMKGWK